MHAQRMASPLTHQDLTRPKDPTLVTIGQPWPKPCGVLPGGGMAADPGHLQVPCLGGQAFLLHHAGRSMGTGLFMHVASPSG